MTTLFDAGDVQRMDRERMLTEQAPRVLPEEKSEEPGLVDLIVELAMAELDGRLE